MEENEEKLTVLEVGYRSQRILDSLRENYLEGICRSNFKEGTNLTYDEGQKGQGLTEAEKYKFGYNPKFRFKALVRLVISHVIWMSSAHEEEKKTDDFAFNLRLLHKKKGQLSLLSYKEKMAILKRPSSRTNEEIQMLSEALAKIKCFKAYDKDIHTELAKGAVLYCFSANREVMRKGNPATGLYLITSGEAATLKLHLDCQTFEPSVIPTSSIIPGQIFGELPLLFGTPRTISVITMTACEMLFWDKDIFDRVLLEAARRKSNLIRSIVSHFAYFTNWNEESLRRLTTKAYTWMHPKDTAILGKDIGEQDTIHVVVKGICSVVQRVDMIHGKNKRGLSFIPYLKKKGDIPPGCFVQTHYLDIAHFKKGMAFNLGESWYNRVVMALNDVMILYIPHNVIEAYEGRDNAWEVIKDFIKANLPEEEEIYAEYKKKFIWLEHREKLREDVILQYKDPKNTEIRDLPITITHLLKREEIQ